MQAQVQSFKAGVAPRATTRAPRRSATAVRAALPRPVEEFAKGAALAATVAGLVLGSGLPAEAAKPAPSSFEINSAYEAELLASLKARGAELPDLKSSPEGTVTAEANLPKFKLSGVEKVKVETPVAVPAPTPAAPAAVEAPKPAPVVAAPAPAPAPAPVAAAPVPKPAAPVAAAPAAAAPAAGPADNKGLIAGAAIAAVAIAAVAGVSSQGNTEGAAAEGAAAAAAPAAPAAAAAPAATNGVPPNVAEARAWIGAWKAKHGKK